MLWTDEGPTLYDIVNLYGYTVADVLGDYPIWDESKRAWLNERIFQRFAYREIACETAQQYNFLMARTMADMAPTINPLFKALDAEHDILLSYVNDSSSTSNDAQKSRQVYSATPQTQLSGVEDYATNLTDADATHGTETESHGSGRGAPVADLLTNWMQGVNNALYIVYNGLEPLHVQIFNIGGIATWQ